MIALPEYMLPSPLCQCHPHSLRAASPQHGPCVALSPVEWLKSIQHLQEDWQTFMDCKLRSIVREGCDTLNKWLPGRQSSPQSP